MNNSLEHHSPASRRAFTLVELARVRRQGAAVVCLSNEKQWGDFFAMFLTEHDGRFEGLDLHKWMDVLGEYSGAEPKIYFCPAATRTAEQEARGSFAAWEEEGRRGSYGDQDGRAGGARLLRGVGGGRPQGQLRNELLDSRVRPGLFAECLSGQRVVEELRCQGGERRARSAGLRLRIGVASSQ